MVPDGWKKATVGQLCSFGNGAGFKASEWSDSGLPIIRIQNLNGSKKFNYFAGEPKTQWVIEPGQLLFAWAGSKGASFGPKIWDGPKGVLNQHIYKLTPAEGIDPTWLYKSLLTVTERIEEKAHGFKATLLHVQKSDITDQVVYVPPLSEQKKIAQTILAWDKAITTTEQLLTNSQQQKKALMQQLLTGKRRLPGFDDWQTCKMSDLIEESRISGSDGAIAKKLTVKLYGKGVIAKEEKRSGSSSTKYYQRRAGQFIYSKLDFLNGAFGIIPEQLDRYESTLDLPAFDIKSNVDKTWFINFVSREDFYVANLGLANGGRKARRVNPKDLLNIQFALPAYKEQQAIAEVLLVSDHEITNFQQKLANLKLEKKALMQQLLTGKRRVTVEEANTE